MFCYISWKEAANINLWGLACINICVENALLVVLGSTFFFKEGSTFFGG